VKARVNGVELFFDADGAKVRLDGSETTNVPTVVIVHTGPGLDHVPYKEHIGGALLDVAQVVYVDLRGCGRSDRSTAAHWNLDTWSDDLRALCDHLGVDRPVILGHGWGCFTALTYAHRWPDHPAKLVLANPSARVVVPRIVARFDEVGGAEAGEAAFNYFENPSESTLTEFLRVCFPLLVPTGLAEVMLTPLWNLELAVHWTGGEGRRVDLRPRLADVVTPAFVVAGADDAYSPAASVQEVVDGLPNARYRRYEGGRHSLFRESPQAIADVKEYIAG
jgi:pimeloyl-ACP methyl ester carboxylesterase